MDHRRAAQPLHQNRPWGQRRRLDPRPLSAVGVAQDRRRAVTDIAAAGSHNGEPAIPSGAVSRSPGLDADMPEA